MAGTNKWSALKQNSFKVCQTETAIFVQFSLKNGSNMASFCLFLFFSHDKYSTNLTIKNKSIDGVLGTQTLSGRMVGTDESTELWWHPYLYNCHCPSLENCQSLLNVLNERTLILFSKKFFVSLSLSCERNYLLSF